MTYPVARIRSMTPRILRRYALWVGSDRPTPRGSGVPETVEVSPVDDMSSMVANELMDETEDLLLLWGFESVRLLGSSRGGFISIRMISELKIELWWYREDAARPPRATW